MPNENIASQVGAGALHLPSVRQQLVTSGLAVYRREPAATSYGLPLHGSRCHEVVTIAADF
jgi:hypothetical protein